MTLYRLEVGATTAAFASSFSLGSGLHGASRTDADRREYTDRLERHRGPGTVVGRADTRMPRVHVRPYHDQLVREIGALNLGDGVVRFRIP